MKLRTESGLKYNNALHCERSFGSWQLIIKSLIKRTLKNYLRSVHARYTFSYIYDKRSCASEIRNLVNIGKVTIAFGCSFGELCISWCHASAGSVEISA